MTNLTKLADFILMNLQWKSIDFLIIEIGFQNFFFLNLDQNINFSL